MSLKNKVVLISGANQGFGLAVAEAFLAQGAKVSLCARNQEKLIAATAELKRKFNKSEEAIFSQTADIANPISVKNWVQATHKHFGTLDILVANAGIYGPKGPIEEVDWDEWSAAIDINVKGVVLQCREVLPYFKQKKYGKIIILSGGGATKPMPNLSAYATSKAAVVRFAETLAEELVEHHIDVNTIAPGALNTRLLDEILEAGPEKVGAQFYKQSLQQKASGGAPLEKGAALCCYLGSAASDGITGKLISAIWDPWQDLQTYKTELRQTDIYTLRRIVPTERGKTWGQNV